MRKAILTMLVALGFVLGAGAQDRTITGRVTDEKGAPIEGVSVVSSDNKNGTRTNSDGSYSVKVSSTTKTLTFSDVNFETRRIKIGSGNSINAELVTKNNKLDEVVVTGYTVKKKTEFTGAASKVASKQIEQVPLASFEQILQGRAPGLYIASGSGQPGTAARVNIRGVGSISGGSDPLYVLDGIPIESAVFRSLNPNDFESVDVLKDAASAGLYGSRGGNGVIVITTKKGKVGKTKIQYRGQMGFSNPPVQNNLDLMNTQQRLQYEEQFLGPSGVIGAGTATGYPGWDYSPTNPAYQSSTAAQKLVFDGLLDSIKKIDTKWADIFFRRSSFKQHELNASGGSDKLTFFTSLSVYQQEGIIIRSNLDRYTFRGNLSFKTDRLTASVLTSAGFSTSKGIESEAGVALANPVAAAFLELPYRKLYKADGTTVDFGAGKTGANAFDRSNTTTQTSNQFKGALSLVLEYEVWKGISLKTTNGLDYRNNNNSRFIDPNSFAGSLVAQGNQGSYNESFDEAVNLVNTSGIVYKRKFGDRHQVNLQALSESIRGKRRSFSATGFGINRVQVNTPNSISAGSATNNFIPVVGGNKLINGISSLFALGDYTFDKRFTISGVVRRDIFSRVPINKTINTSSVGFTWNATEEKFFKKQNIFQEFRMRVSKGATANINSLPGGDNGFGGDFAFLSSFSSTTYSGTPAIVPTAPGNPEAKVERQLLTNFGVDLTLWKGRVRITTDLYKKESIDQFISQNLSRTSGFRALSTNGGKMENKGFDFAINTDIVKSKEVLVTLGINGGFLKSEITDLGGLPDIPGGTGIARVGLPFGTHFTVGYKGINPQTGLPIYEDINGNATTDYSAANSRAEFGTYLPKFTGGTSLDVSWKGFDLGVLLSTAQGVKRFNNESFFYETTNSNVAFNKRVDMLNSWRNPGEQTNYQKINSLRQFSSKDIQDASFVRLRNVQVGYTYKTKEGSKIRGFRVWGQAQNLYTWTKWNGFDPEESNNIATYEFPNPKTYTMGLDINF
jgi:TonB-linked SusC/RagA family outer membrane protein